MALVAANCPSCGAAVDIPDGRDTFHCVYCGQRIVMEREKSDSASATAGPDINNLMDLAEMAESSGNYEEAYRYCSQVLERDTKNVGAWIGKGIAAGWQSTLAAPRIAETINCLRKALTLRIPSNELVQKAAVGGHGVAVGFYNLALNHYLRFQHDTTQYTSGMLDLIASAIEDSTNNKLMAVEFANQTIASLELSMMIWQELEKNPQFAGDIAMMCQQLLALRTLRPEATAEYRGLLATVSAWGKRLDTQRDQRRKSDWEEVSRRAKTAGAATRDFSMRCWRTTAKLPTRMDGALLKAVGEDNGIIYRFLQLLLYVGVPVMLAAVICIRWIL